MLNLLRYTDRWVTGWGGLVTDGDGLVFDPSPTQVVRTQAIASVGDGCDGFFPLSTYAHPHAHTRTNAKYENPSPPVTRHQSVTRRSHGR